MTVEYNITAETSKGVKNGKLKVDIDKGSMSGSINIAGRNMEFSNGRIEKGRFIIQGSENIYFLKVPYVIKGTLDDGVINGIIQTSYGDIIVKGTEITKL